MRVLCVCGTYIHIHIYMGVSLNGGTPISHPNMIILSRKTHWFLGKPTISGNPRIRLSVFENSSTDPTEDAKAVSNQQLVAAARRRQQLRQDKEAPLRVEERFPGMK